MTDQLFTEIQSIADFSTEDITLFRSTFEEVFIPKGEHFLLEGQISKSIGYIQSGLTMHYKLIDGTEIPCDFTIENEWVAYLKSFTTGTVSDMNIKALEDTHVLLLSNVRMGELFAAQPKFMALRSYYTELAFMRNAEHAANLATLQAKQRYYKFLTDRPGLINRVPQYHIAAYLGIQPQSLSRLKK
jgi:CRP-like cAMP-binding protein